MTPNSSNSDAAAGNCAATEKKDHESRCVPENLLLWFRVKFVCTQSVHGRCVKLYKGNHGQHKKYPKEPRVSSPSQDVEVTKAMNCLLTDGGVGVLD